MSTKIPWADETWNPITGCTPISEGCQNCYAKKMTARKMWDYDFTPGLFHEKRLNQPMHWKKPRRIFVCSMGDLFHDDVDIRTIYDVLEVVESCPRHTFIVLTKRAGRMRDVALEWSEDSIANDGDRWRTWESEMPNLWLGVSAENQKRFDERVPILMDIPAAVRFVSVEPMLGPVDLHVGLGPDWVIAGPETGTGARPRDNEWIDSLSLQSKCFFDKRDKWARREFPA